MAESRPVSSAQKKQETAKIWLSYYNRVLYEKGIISEQERNRMTLKIDKWQMPQQALCASEIYLPGNATKNSCIARRFVVWCFVRKTYPNRKA